MIARIDREVQAKRLFHAEGVELVEIFFRMPKTPGFLCER